MSNSRSNSLNFNSNSKAKMKIKIMYSRKIYNKGIKNLVRTILYNNKIKFKNRI